MLAADLVVKLGAQDSLRFETQTQALRLVMANQPGNPRQRATDQSFLARYVGEPLAGHQVQAETGLRAEGAGNQDQPWLNVERLRVHAQVADTWRLSAVFALEGALRVEATDRGRPALAPALALHYQPFPQVFVRANAAAGYRYQPMVPDPDELPIRSSWPSSQRRDPESTRQGALSLAWEPDSHLRLLAEAFRSDLTASATPLQVGALTAGLAWGQRTLDPVSAHVQGLRTQLAAHRLVGGVGVDASYTWLQEALDDVTGARLPWAARHQLTFRALWEPRWLGVGMETAVEAWMDRVDAAGKTLPAQGLVHVGAWRMFGPLQVACMLDNAMNTVDPLTGPREGRSARCVARFSPGTGTR